MRRRILAAGLLGASWLVGPAATAAEYVAPPVMPVPGAWQGKAEAVVRVLNKLDTHVAVLTLAVNQTGSVGSLSVTPRSCLVRPDGLPRDAASLLAAHDAKGTTPDFSGWMFAAEPSVGVFESPVYGVQLVGCAGADVAPMAPPLPPPVSPPPSMQASSPADAGAAPPDGSRSDGSRSDGSPADGSPAAPEAVPQPDPVYPDGQPSADQPPPEQTNPDRPAPARPVPGPPVPDQPPPGQPDPDQAPPQSF